MNFFFVLSKQTMFKKANISSQSAINKYSTNSCKKTQLHALNFMLVQNVVSHKSQNFESARDCCLGDEWSLQSLTELCIKSYQNVAVKSYDIFAL